MPSILVSPSAVVTCPLILIKRLPVALSAGAVIYVVTLLHALAGNHVGGTPSKSLVQRSSSRQLKFADQSLVLSAVHDSERR
jgi:hypothetical protein